MNLNKLLNGATSFFAMLALVAGWIITFSNILPPKVVGYAQAVMGLLTLLHAWKAQYGGEIKKIAAQAGIDISGVTIGVVLVALTLWVMPSRAQMLGASHARGAQSYLSTALANDAGPDTVVLVSGGGVNFDTMTAPFPIELSITEYRMIAGVQIPVSPSYFEDCKVTYVGHDTLVIGTRATNGTVRRAWGPGSKVEVGPSLSYISQLIDTASMLTSWRYNTATTADSNTSSTTFINMPLALPVGVSQTWGFEIWVADSSSSAAGVKYTLTVPTGATLKAGARTTTTGGTALLSENIYAAAASTAYRTAQASGQVILSGTIKTDGTHSGSLVLQGEKVTSGNLVVFAGSYLRAWRIN